MLVFEECEPVNAPYLSHQKDLLACFLGILCSVEKRCKVRYRITTISRRANLVLHPDAAFSILHCAATRYVYAAPDTPQRSSSSSRDPAGLSGRAESKARVHG